LTYCVDASAAVRFLVPTPGSEPAQPFWWEALREGERLVAPPLLYAETTSAVRRCVYNDFITHDEAVGAVRLLLGLPIEIDARVEQYEDALEFANRLGHSKAYDVQYLAVAHLNRCPIVTADRAMAAVAGTLNIRALLIA
jgi:predicted nucleic acid-binding protein